MKVDASILFRMDNGLNTAVYRRQHRLHCTCTSESSTHVRLTCLTGMVFRLTPPMVVSWS